MKKRVVVAKYKEDLDWLKYAKDEGFDIVIYNKDCPHVTNNFLYCEKVFSIENSISLYNLMNIGRESHTYLLHIVNNYENLYDIEFFLQGDPVQHICEYSKPTNTYDDDVKHLWDEVKKCEEYDFYDISNYEKIQVYSEAQYTFIKSVFKNHPHINQHYNSENNSYTEGHTIHETVEGLFKDLFGYYPPKDGPLLIKANALFSLKKETLLKFPKTFYINLLNYFNPAIKNEKQIIAIGHTLEHFWKLMFLQNGIHI